MLFQNSPFHSKSYIIENIICKLEAVYLGEFKRFYYEYGVEKALEIIKQAKRLGNKHALKWLNDDFSKWVTLNEYYN